MNEANFGNVRQLGYLVADIDEAVTSWSKTQALGPWTVIKNVPLQATYKGQPCEPVIDIALAYRGEVQIELIQQKNQEPSPYLSFFAENRLGLHHIAYISEDIEADVQRACAAGHEIVFDIRMPDQSRYVYTQVTGMGDQIFFEFLEATEVMKDMFSKGMAAAEAWDGSEDITVIDFAG